MTDIEAKIAEIRQDFADLKTLEDRLAATRKLSTLLEQVGTSRRCFFCAKPLMAEAGFIETVGQPDGERRDFCGRECLHWQLHEDEKL